MNEQRMDDLISGLTRSTEIRGVLPQHTNNTSNTENKQNTDKRNNTDNTSHNVSKGRAAPILSQQESRFCTIVEVNTLKKIRIIAKREGLQIKEVVGAAFLKAIMTYEAKHGSIDGTQQSRADSLF